MLSWAPFGSIIFFGYEAFSAKRAECFGEKEKLVTLNNYFVNFFSKTQDKSPFLEISGYVWTGPLSGSVVTSFFYRIYSINRPRRLLNFWILRVGAYSGLGAY